MKIIDTHTHLNDEGLYKDREDIIKRSKLAGVEKVINNGDSFESFDVINFLAKEYPDFCYSAIGLFPTTEYSDLSEEIRKLNEKLDEAVNLVAIGEIGLDYHLDNSLETKNKQKELFKAQIEVARERKLPIIVHSRDAEADTFNTIIDSKFPYDVILHCYSASFQMALRYLRHKKNVYFGIGGVLTFKNAVKLVEVVKRVPPDHFVLETDAPYLTPHPFRGKRNDPSYIVYTLKKMAELLNRDENELAEEIYLRSKEIYNLR
ncbi:MAG: TatD family hydrolase [Firmicutes bacterium]|uniref:TatD family hydrolase n=1 Tax=Candidatus Scatoplasma merdavium TaxID=2840932 RepID=A0A9D9D991_9BACL|nr:TatD family hydrolase [Candidatus Scatoplasma merdavium]